MRCFLYWLALGLSFTGLVGATTLSWNQTLTGQACPVIVIPVCYVINLVFLGLFLGLILRRRNKIWAWIFNICLGIGLSISTLATFSQFRGAVSCPLSDLGIPLCYLAWGTFLLIFTIHIALNFMNSKR